MRPIMLLNGKNLEETDILKRRPRNNAEEQLWESGMTQNQTLNHEKAWASLGGGSWNAIFVIESSNMQ